MKGTKPKGFSDWAYITLLVLGLIFFLTWRFFGIDVLDSKIEGNMSNYPFITGIVFTLLGVIYTWSNLKENKETGDFFPVFDCWRPIALTVFGLFLAILSIV